MKTAIALGTFDGLHKGHLAVIKKTEGFFGIAVTFCLPPKNVIFGEPQLLILPNERKMLLEKLGIDQVVMQNFEDIRNIEALSYLKDLKKKYNPARIICGFNYRFGKDALGNTEMLTQFCRQNNIEFCCVEAQTYDKKAISSTVLREYIKNGEIEKANKLLYNGFSFTAEVSHGDARGRTIGFPTANQLYPELLVKPKFGVYISQVTVDGKNYNAITNIGVRPTYKTNTVGCETYIKDFSGDIYGKQMKTRLIKFVREEQKFSSLEELKKAILNDVKLIG